MTRKDYILIADTIRTVRLRINDTTMDETSRGSQLRGVRRTAAHLADALGKENPRFDPVVFLKACGYGAGPTFKGETFAQSEERMGNG